MAPRIFDQDDLGKVWGRPDLACEIGDSSAFAFSFSMIFAAPLIAYDRFVSVFRSQHYPFLFNRRNVVGMCLGADFLGVCAGALLYYFQNFVYLPNEHECIWSGHGERRVKQMRLVLQGGLLLFAVGALSAAAYFNWKTHKGLQEHQGRLLNLQQRQRYEENKMVLKAAVLQLLVPLICTLPGLLGLLLMYGEWYLYESVSLKRYYDEPAELIYSLNPAADALLAIRVLKPYREEVKRYLRELSCNRWQFGPQEVGPGPAPPPARPREGPRRRNPGAEPPLQLRSVSGPQEREGEP